MSSSDVTRRASPPQLVGVVHLLPLPGSPARGPGLPDVIARAVHDLRALHAGGAHAAIVENLGDAPFAATTVGPSTVAHMTAVAVALRAACPDLPLGINVLRNDAAAALAIATAAGAAFIRVNVHVGVMVTDQGVITGDARQTLLLRNRLGSDVRIAADVLVKHAVPLGSAELQQVARDTWHRGRANALIVTGTGTGQPTNPGRVAAVRAAVPEATVWVGSGLTPATAHAVRPLIDGAIVGTWLHRDADLALPLDPDRVRQMAAALGSG